MTTAGKYGAGTGQKRGKTKKACLKHLNTRIDPRRYLGKIKCERIAASELQDENRRVPPTALSSIPRLL